MATEKFDGVDDSEIFSDIQSDEAPEVPAEVAAEPEQPTEGQPRDEHGRFAPKVEAEPQAEPGAQAQPEPDRGEANVPSWRLREIAEERRQWQTRAEEADRRNTDLARQMADLQRRMEQNAPQPEPIDPYADLNGYLQQTLTPFEQRMSQMQSNLVLRASRAENVAVHGREAVEAAEKAIGEAMNSNHPDIPALRAKMSGSDDPVGVAIEWHKQSQMLKETGGDLNAYRERTLAEALKDPAFLAKALEAAKQSTGGQAQPRNIINLPPSIAKLSSAQSQADDDGDMSDGALFAHATR